MPLPLKDSDSRTQVWKDQDRKHYLHPFTNYKALSDRGSKIITRGDGVYIWDSDGARILDGMSGLWCVNVGYGRQELVQAAAAQLEELPYYNSFFGTATPPSVELAELIAEVAPEGFNRAFFTGSGSESIDTALRIIRRYWQVEGETSKRYVIGRNRAYHGSSIAGVGLGGMAKMHQQGAMNMPDFERIGEPDWYRRGQGLSPHEFGLLAAQELETKILELGCENVAAFVAEPIQGAGGVIIPPDSYWPEINRICKQHDVLLVADEVITGFGRTGRWFASEYFGIQPDLITVAKGLSSGYLPIGAVLVSDRVADALTSTDDDFTHGFTYSGHPACCAVAAENIRILQREHIVERVQEEIGPYFAERWLELADHELVGEARCAGLVAGMELVSDKATGVAFEPGQNVGAACRDFCIDGGVMLRAVGDIVVAAPPLVIGRSEVDQLVECLRKSLDLTKQSLCKRTNK